MPWLISTLLNIHVLLLIVQLLLTDLLFQLIHGTLVSFMRSTDKVE